MAVFDLRLRKVNTCNFAGMRAESSGGLRRLPVTAEGTFVLVGYVNAHAGKRLRKVVR